MDALKKTMLSEHFSIKEATSSATATRNGIHNAIPEAVMPVIIKSALGMERVRAALDNKPITINSWYRCPELNKAVGSTNRSQHIAGEAIDFVCPSFGSAVQIAKRLIQHKDLIRFDQLILEHTWIHISFAISTGKPRNQVLSLLRSGGYATGLTDRQGHPL